MKELSIEEKAKRYDEALAMAKECITYVPDDAVNKYMLNIFPELAESDDEKIRKELIQCFSDLEDQENEWYGSLTPKDIIAWLEKQGNNINCIYDKELSELLHIVICRYINDPDISYPERENVSKKIPPYVELLEKQGEQKPVPDWMPKFLDELRSKKNYFDWDEHKDSEGRILAIINWMNLNYFNEKDGKQKADKVEPKFKVKYAGSEYNVLKVKDIAGVTYYGIEDEPNHIDYIKADNCEIISGYGIKENGSPYPTKPAVFSRQKPADKVRPKFKVGDVVKHKDNPHLTYILKRFTDDGDYEFHAIGKDGNEGCTCFAVVKYQDEWELVEQNTTWNEEDEIRLKHILRLLDVKDDKKYLLMFGLNSLQDLEKDIDWLKSIKDRVQPQSQWKPSDEQMKALNYVVNLMASSESPRENDYYYNVFKDLRKQLKKLREE